MRESQSAHNCRWAQQTILLPWPFWYAASADEWTCTRNGVPRILHDSAVCAHCVRWRDAEVASQHASTGCEHRHALVFMAGPDLDIPTVS